MSSNKYDTSNPFPAQRGGFVPFNTKELDNKSHYVFRVTILGPKYYESFSTER